MAKIRMANSSFSFFFRQVQNKYYKAPAILYAAHSNKLPAVMHMDEIFAIINSYKNKKHKMLIILLYSTGMRLSEIAKLKIADIDSKLMRIKIVSGKGDKDRFVPLSQQVLLQLRAYYLQYKPVVYLFNSSAKGKHYSTRTIQHILQNTLAKLGLDNKDYSVHTVRHSFATHMLDNGADIQLIQEILGHKSILQTMKYLHLTDKRMKQAVNPYDAMMAQLGNADKLAK